MYATDKGSFVVEGNYGHTYLVSHSHTYLVCRSCMFTEMRKANKAKAKWDVAFNVCLYDMYA